MANLDQLLQTADFKTEKHVPVIEVEPGAKKGEPVEIKISIGKEIAHPNTTQHHITWISLFFLPDGDKYPIHIGDINFSAHGSSVQGADTSTVYTNYKGVFSLTTEKQGNLLASSYCNIHGLWQSSKQLKLNS
ncbi:MAG: class II SORL domain-containing protein [Actinomycetota bacterium]|jgi:superoxide reductase|nr:class II SORL domain-containing protein [Actinomycetota bacterium]